MTPPEFVLLVRDLDARGPGGDPFVQWLVYNLPSTSTGVSGGLPEYTIQGINDTGGKGYASPCPTRGQKHRYVATIFALKRRLHLNVSVPWLNIQHRVQLLQLASASVSGTYSR